MWPAPCRILLLLFSFQVTCPLKNCSSIISTSHMFLHYKIMLTRYTLLIPCRMVLLLFLHRILITLQNHFLFFFASNVAHILQKNFPILHSIHESRTLNLIYWEAYQGGNERYCVSKNVFQLFFPYATLFSYITNPENI